jgi:DNA polymerase III epsilon subunit family exonuclease
VRWKHRPIVAFDTETTGLLPFSGDRIIEFAAVRCTLGEDGRPRDFERWSTLVNPGMPLPKATRDITGITDADVATAPTFSEVAEKIRELLADAVTVAHNYPFDLAFVSEELARVELAWPEPLAEVDTVDVSLRCFPEARSHRLADLCERVDVTLEGAHRATNDAEATLRAFVELVRRHDVEDDLHAMLDWAHAIGRPPEDGPLDVDGDGRVRFAVGPHEGQAIAEHPVHLQWMLKARERSAAGWTYRYPESSRRWIRRWLDVRGAGRARPSAKSVRSEDWMLDPCIAPPDRRFLT